MQIRGERRLWIIFGLLLAASVAVKLALGHHAGRGNFDIRSYLVTADALRHHPLDVYRVGARWPYPPAFLPWVDIVTTKSVTSSLSFEIALRLPMVIADGLMAWLAQDYLRRRGAGEATRLAAAACVLIGPVFVAVSGWHGQLDSVAVLAGVAAVWVWDRDGEHRALLTGILIGCGAAVKTFPLFMLIAFLPLARARAERIRLVLPALLIPLLVLSPFLIANASDTTESLRANQGFPGFNGLSFLGLHPRLSWLWQGALGWTPGSRSNFFQDIQQPLVLLGIAGVALLNWRKRLEPAAAAALLWLVVLTVNPNFAWHYLVWGIPFWVMAGHWRAAALLQVVAAAPLWMFYGGLDTHSAAYDFGYTPLALGLYAGMVVAATLVLRSVMRAPTRSRPPAAVG